MQNYECAWYFTDQRNWVPAAIAQRGWGHGLLAVRLHSTKGSWLRRWKCTALLHCVGLIVASYYKTGLGGYFCNYIIYWKAANYMNLSSILQNFLLRKKEKYCKNSLKMPFFLFWRKISGFGFPILEKYFCFGLPKIFSLLYFQVHWPNTNNRFFHPFLWRQRECLFCLSVILTKEFLLRLFKLIVAFLLSEGLLYSLSRKIHHTTK